MVTADVGIFPLFGDTLRGGDAFLQGAAGGGLGMNAPLRAALACSATSPRRPFGAGIIGDEAPSARGPLTRPRCDTGSSTLAE